MAATSFLTMTEAKLPPGFRFHPRDEELINEYLAKKLSGEFHSCPMMEDVDLNKVEPWELPATACVGGKEWYFYSLRDKKYATGQRTNRATLSGYWKATGKDRHISDARRGGILVGMRKTLVFYQGRAPKGKKTHWVMHEFRMEPAPAVDDHRHQQQHLLLHHHPHPHLHLPKPAQHAPTPTTTVVPAPCSSSSTSYSVKEDWVLCRVFYKSRGLSPKQLQGNIMRGLENCTYMTVDDTGSSSLPPLMDTTYINFQQQSQNHQTNMANNINNSAVPVQIAHAGGYNINEPQVPCFSNLRYNNNTHLPPLMENANNNVSAPAASTSTSTSQIGRTTTTRLPDMTSFLGPLVNYGCEN